MRLNHSQAMEIIEAAGDTVYPEDVELARKSTALAVPMAKELVVFAREAIPELTGKLGGSDVAAQALAQARAVVALSDKFESEEKDANTA